MAKIRYIIKLFVKNNDEGELMIFILEKGNELNCLRFWVCFS